METIRAMLAHRGKAGMAIAGALAAAAIAGAALAQRGRILESYHLWRLESESEESRMAAVRALGERRSLESIPRLLEIARKDFERWGPREPRSHPHVFPALEKIFSAGPATVPWMAFILRDPDPRFRLLGASCLEKAGREAGQAAPGLVEALGDSDPEVSRAAGKALEAAGEPALPHLLRALSDSRFTVRLQAAYVLGQLRAAGRPAVPALIDALDDDHPRVRYFAADALGRIEAEEALPALRRLLQDPDPAVAEKTTKVLHRLAEN